MKSFDIFLNYKLLFYLHNIGMSENNITFNDRKSNKSNFYRTKRLFKIDDIDVYKILISKKEPYGKNNPFKYF